MWPRQTEEERSFLRDFEHSMVVGTILAGVSISETAYRLGLSSMMVPVIYR